MIASDEYRALIGRLAATLLIAYFGAASTAALALEFSGTCRGASATITTIEGIDTSRARVVAQYTRPDAISYCHYSLGRGQNAKQPKAAAVQSCADKFLRDAAATGPVTAEANCQIGKLSTASAKWSNSYSFPLQPMCGDDNNQAIAVFRVMCPSFEKVEAELP